MVGALSDVGNVRRINEDSFGIYENDNIGVYIVADGMGGHKAGEIASRIAVDKTLEYMRSLKDFSRLKESLREGIKAANKEIYRLSLKDRQLSGMGTTITACVIDKNSIIIANIGDSSGFIIKDNAIMKITKDHSLVQELVDEGSITEAEAKNHPNKNIITRSLGIGSSVEADIYEIPSENISKVILCSDGLTDEVMPEEIYQCIEKSADNMGACKELIDMAKARGGRDNISVMIFEGECRDDRNYSGQ